LAAALNGCPLSSSLPLVEPSAAVPDSALVGAWYAKDPDTAEAQAMIFQVFNEHEMVAFTPGDKGEIDAFRVLAGPVGGAPFLSVRELGSADAGWSLVRYRLAGDTLVLSVLDDGLFAGRTFAATADLAAFVAQNIDNPLLYAAAGEARDDMTWTRGTP
jgi:hypothetical protein